MILTKYLLVLLLLLSVTLPLAVVQFTAHHHYLLIILPAGAVVQAMPSTVELSGLSGSILLVLLILVYEYMYAGAEMDFQN